jgi:uncharacterized protein YcfL
MKKLLVYLLALPLGMACESDRHREMLETQKILRETQRMLEENERKLKQLNQLKQIEEDQARRERREDAARRGVHYWEPEAPMLPIPAPDAPK